VADADPEDEVGDVPRPVGCAVLAPDADARGDEIEDAQPGERRQPGGDAKEDPPPDGRGILDDGGDLVADPDSVALVVDVGLAHQIGAGLDDLRRFVHLQRIGRRCVGLEVGHG
jgi:hypothetical protein